MKMVNLETTTDARSLYKIQSLNGHNLTRAKQKLLRRRTRVHESFSSRRKSRKSLIQTILWNLANPVMTCHGTIVRQRPIDPRQLVLLRESGTQNKRRNVCCVLLQSGLDEKWWAGSMECCCCFRSVQDLLADGKAPYKKPIRRTFTGPVIPFGSVVEYHPISAKDQSRLHQVGKEVQPGIFIGAGQFRRVRRPRSETRC